MKAITVDAVKSIDMFNALRGASLVVPAIGAVGAAILGEPLLICTAAALTLAFLLGAKFGSASKRKSLVERIDALREHGTLLEIDAARLKMLSNRLAFGSEPTKTVETGEVQPAADQAPAARVG